MKKICLVFVCLVTVVFFAGCEPKTKSSQDGYPWYVITLLQFEISSASVPATAKTNLETYLELQTTGFAKVDYAVVIEGDILQVALGYEDYNAFVAFNDLIFTEDELGAVVDCTIKEKLFFFERTQKFENPWKSVLDNSPAKTNAIVGKVEELFFSSGQSQPSYIFVFSSSFRRTKVPGTVSVSNSADAYDYYFMYGGDERSLDEIVIFDRFANQPIWYGIAVGSTAVFMAAVYFVLRIARPKKNLPQTLNGV